MTNCEKVRQGTKRFNITMRPLNSYVSCQGLSRDAKNCKLRKTNGCSEFKKWLAWIPCWTLLGLINVESRGDTPYYGLYKEAFPVS